MSDENPFNILGNTEVPKFGTPIVEQGTTEDLGERIKAIISSSDTMLFMKGTPDFPQCGFSANTVAMLNHLGVTYKTFDILSDMSIREGVKAYSNWPTYPQLYFKEKLVGGNDILTEMFQDGDLLELLKPAGDNA
ncbi:MAG: Grx4 family monothiol glutaredoxin [Bacteriovoracaceae bacterium]|jgi:monothiol glutaredoxin|nr:Grx4 family monothiol glutaredoxin [Bacteriovoracaceae bacterium]